MLNTGEYSIVNLDEINCFTQTQSNNTNIFLLLKVLTNYVKETLLLNDLKHIYFLVIVDIMCKV